MVKNANEANKPEGKSPNKKEKKKQFMVPKATLRGIERSQILTQNPEWDKTKPVSYTHLKLPTILLV